MRKKMRFLGLIFALILILLPSAAQLLGFVCIYSTNSRLRKGNGVRNGIVEINFCENVENKVKKNIFVSL
jgi:chromate transport protein ChrA